MTQISPAPPRKSRGTSAKAVARQRHRRRVITLWAVSGVLTVVVAVVTILGVMGARSGGADAQTSNTTTPGTTLMQRVSQVDPAVLSAVGSAGLPSTFASLKGAPALTGASGRPEMLYIGADYCPYCAAQRWSLVVALSRFGSFDSLALTRSSSSDVYPDTATFSFSGAHYTSPYLDFVAVETADRTGNPKEQPTAAQRQLLTTYDAPPYVPASAAGGIPWVDVGGRYAMVSSGFTPQILAGLDWNAIAGKLSDPKDLVTQGIVGNANNITAAICKVTGMQPAAVCGAAPVAGLVAQLP
ncbi:MAG TPA: DUF929 family protein [Candidatus Dormibacteraeota bacterium]|nr:DUF929 family protein [Candidatus Dormibacteraeota bacterium]